MKTITITEFKTLIARNDWQHEQGYEEGVELDTLVDLIIDYEMINFI